MIFMRKIGIIFLSVIMVISLVACNSGGGKTKKVTEEQTESVKPTEKATESVKSTEEVTETIINNLILCMCWYFHYSGASGSKDTIFFRNSIS